MRLAFWVGIAALVVPACTSAPEADDAGGRDAAVVPCARDLDCDDGHWCNGTERCVHDGAAADARGCAAGTPACATGEVCDETMDRCRTDCADADGDGAADAACGGTDCDDADPHRFPGNLETCDLVDQDCDATTLGYRDEDHDGLTATACCNPTGTGSATTCGTDCDDASSLVGEGATEVCDGRDNDCNGMIDDATSMVDWYPDGDGDGFGDPTASPVSSCALVDGRVPNDGDCDDTRARRSPGAPEVCDGIDNDCDTHVDESALPLPWFIDFDGDGFGDPTGEPLASCAPVPGHALDPTDCDDEDAARNPAQAEVCDGEDNDCDTHVDENVPELRFYADADGDGFGTSTDAIMACRSDATHETLNAGDCDDSMPLVNPRGVEVCNAIDDDCNRIVDGNCFADVVVDPTTVDPRTGRVTAICAAGEVMIGIEYYTTRYCDLGCTGYYVAGIDAICASPLMTGSPSPPVRYTFPMFGEHVIGAGTGTVLRCPVGSIVTGIAPAGNPTAGLTVSCRALGTDPAAFALGAQTLLDWPPGYGVTECPAATPALTGFVYDYEPLFFGVDHFTQTVCSSVALSTALP